MTGSTNSRPRLTRIEAAWHELDAQIMRDYAPWAPLVNPVRVTIVAEGYCGLLSPVYQLDLTTLGQCQ